MLVAVEVPAQLLQVVLAAAAVQAVPAGAILEVAAAWVVPMVEQAEGLLEALVAAEVVQVLAEPRPLAATRWFWTWMVTASKPQAPAMARSSCSITMPTA
jgi:hypothetical protein